uniref:Uncharacterized protein n=1 Tax=Oryza barthii TaxID=65489 RepID=A0A0D3G4T1_9ORYZ
MPYVPIGTHWDIIFLLYKCYSCFCFSHLDMVFEFSNDPSFRIYIICFVNMLTDFSLSTNFKI